MDNLQYEKKFNKECENYKMIRQKRKFNSFPLYLFIISLFTLILYNYICVYQYYDSKLLRTEDTIKEIDNRLDLVEGNNIRTNYVSVGKNGDYADIKVALDSITDNSYNNRYVITVDSGDYDYSNDETVPYLGLKNYVSIVGKDRGTCKIINKKSTTSCNWNYSGIDPAYYNESIMEASIENFTIITQGCKSPIHIDTDYNHLAFGGKITINNCNLVDLNTALMDGFEGSGAGGVNVGLRAGQSVIVKNCNSNGIIYAHNSPNQNVKEGCYFEIYNCRFKNTMIGDLCSNSYDRAYIHGSKFDYMNINVYPLGTDLKKYNWTIDLDSNDIGQIYGYHNQYPNDKYYLWDNYFGGKFAVNDSSIHDYCYNSSNETIERGSFVKLLEHQISEIFGTSIKLADNSDLYGVALENIAAGDIGIVQFAGIIDIKVDFAVNYGDKLLYNNNLFSKNDNGNLIVLESFDGNGEKFIKVKIEK